MRRTGTWLGLLALVLVAGMASAAPSGFGGVDGDWSDWFTYGGDVSNTDWDQLNAIANRTDGLIRYANAPAGENNGGAGKDEFGDGTTPHIGGQEFDVEQIFYYFEDFDEMDDASGGILHVGLVTGFPPGGTSNLLAGDLFWGFGTGPSAALTFALGVSTNTDTPEEIARYGQVYGGSAFIDSLYPEAGYQQDPWRIDENHGSTVLGPNAADMPQTVGLAWGGDGMDESTLAGDSAVHYFLEVAILVDGLQEQAISDPDDGGIQLHWTMECGNDFIDVVDGTPFTPVPEPTTMVLLGMGVVGMALRARRRPMC